VEGCFWEQDERVWTEYGWEEMHHGSMSYFNGALLHLNETAGCFVMRGNYIINVFNGFRTSFNTYHNQNANVEIYDNIFKNHDDNAIEPEAWTFNLHVHHNHFHNIHKCYSFDEVRGGPIYVYGNIHTQSDDPLALEEVSGIWKFKGSNSDYLTYPCYVFNNSFYTEARAFKDGEGTNREMKHFNNVYCFFSGSNRFNLSDWHESFEFDYDCNNQEWPANIENNDQEENGIVADALFIDGPAMDLHLQNESPCIDAGRIMVLDEFDWTQEFYGSAPDMGAYENGEAILGPAYSFQEPPNGSPCVEKARMVRHRVYENELIVWFSFPLNPSSLNLDDMFITQGPSGDDRPALNSFELDHSGRKLTIQAGENLDPETVELNFTTLPRGTNGENATRWASSFDYKNKATDIVTSVEEDQKNTLPENPLLIQIYPNPFNSVAKVIVHNVHKDIPLSIYNVMGQKVASLLPYSSIGRKNHYWLNAEELASGSYFAVCKDLDRNTTKRFLLVR